VSLVSPHSIHSEARQDYLLTPILAAQKYVLCTYNVERSKLDEARKITPGRRAPTVNALEEDGWVAVQAMVLRNDIAIAMDKLTVIGASDLIVTKIENSRTGD
jgi:ATP phosphoribosyltransferase